MTSRFSKDSFDTLLEEAAREDSLLLPGTALLNSRFIIQKLLGSGGMGVVYEASDTEHQKCVVIKTITSIGGEGVYRLKREFRSLADVVHPHLVGLHELFVDGSLCFFTMDRVPGVSLLEYMGESPAPEKVVDIFSQLAVGIEAIHSAGKLHRDLKPSNVMVTPEDRVVILDFGLACDQLSEDPGQTILDELSGTPLYIPPEQISGYPATRAGDWYAFGVMLYEVLCGHPPFTGTSRVVLSEKVYRKAPVPENWDDRISDDIKSLCIALLARNPESRPGYAHIEKVFCSQNDVRSEPNGLQDESMFIGRETELAKLEDALATTNRGLPMMALLSGSSGVGKTALLTRFAGRLNREHRAVAISSRCYERESVPYKGCDALVDAISRYLRRQSGDRVVNLLPRRVQALMRVFPVFERLPALNRIRQRLPLPPDPAELRRQGEGALKELLCRLAEQEQVVLVVDDFQWSDVDGARLLSSLLAPPDAPPILWIVAFRSEDTPSGAGLEILTEALEKYDMIPCRRIALQPLLAAESLALSEQLSPGAAPRTISRIAEQSQGSPFLITMMSRHADRDLPEGQFIVEDAVKTATCGLSSDEHALFEALCVAGRAVEVRLLQRVTRCRDILPPIRRLLADRLVRWTGGYMDRVAVYHDRVKDAIVSQLSKARHTFWHRRFAEAIVALSIPDPVALTHHYLGAGDAETAGKTAILAAKKAEAALAFSQAAALYDVALAHAALSSADRLALHVCQAEVLANGFRAAEAGAVYLNASRIASTDLERGELRTKGAEQLLISGQVHEGIRVLKEAFHDHGFDYDALTSSDCGALYGALLGTGLRFTRRPASELAPDVQRRLDTLWCASLGLSHLKYEETFKLSLHYALEALELGVPFHIIRAFVGVSIYESSLLPETPKAFRFLQRLCREENTAIARLYLELTEANIALFHSEFDVLKRSAGNTLRLIADASVGLTRELTMARTLMMIAYLKSGDLMALARDGMAWLAELERQNNVHLSSWISTYLVFYYLAKGSPAQARNTLARAAAYSDGVSPEILDMARRQYSALCDAFEGRPEGLERIRALDRIFIERPGLAENPMKQSDQAYLKGLVILRLIGTGRDKAPLLEEVEAAASLLACFRTRDGRTVSFPYWRPQAELLRAGIAARRGDAAATTAHLDTALALSESENISTPVKAAVMLRKGQLMGGREGASIIRNAEAALRRLGVDDVARFVDLFAPVFSN